MYMQGVMYKCIQAYTLGRDYRGFSPGIPYHFRAINFPIPGFPGKSIIIFINLTYS